MRFCEDKIVFEFRQGPLNQADCLAQTYINIQQGDAGAQSVFSGFIRSDEKAGEFVREIEYTAYPEMVQVQIQAVLSKIVYQNHLKEAWVFHSLGRVGVGECCLIVVVYAAHRREAIQGCTALTEAIKSELPIWGKELLSNQSESWKTNF
jgi:molybdopterin synthase catalytic subunit